MRSKIVIAIAFGVMVNGIPLLNANADDTVYGKASFYHAKFEGRQTANGLRFSNQSSYCAHKTLPFNTIVEVTNQMNGKSIHCRVVDRGPFKRGRIIDLSRRLAQQLEMVSNGVVDVEVKTVCNPSRLSTRYGTKIAEVNCKEFP